MGAAILECKREPSQRTGPFDSSFGRFRATTKNSTAGMLIAGMWLGSDNEGHFRVGRSCSVSPGKSRNASKERIPFQGLQARVPGHFNWYPQDRGEKD